VNACQFSVILFIILLLEIIVIVTIFVFRDEVCIRTLVSLYSQQRNQDSVVRRELG